MLFITGTHLEMAKKDTFAKMQPELRMRSRTFVLSVSLISNGILGGVLQRRRFNNGF